MIIHMYVIDLYLTSYAATRYICKPGSGFLKLLLFRKSVCMCVFVYVSAPTAINN